MAANNSNKLDYIIASTGFAAKSNCVFVLLEAIASGIEDSKATHALIPQMIKSNDKQSHSPEGVEDEERSYEEFLEDLAIDFAPRHDPYFKKKAGHIPTASSTPGEIREYRERILNHKETRRRFVFQEWPRDPKSDKAITPENSKMGKMTPNGLQVWGATLVDFYIVHRLPTLINLMTRSSGSKLAAWMKDQGEMYAADLIAKAEREPEPSLVLPYDITQLIEDSENSPFNKKSWVKKDPKDKNKQTYREDWELPKPWPPPSPFDPLAYPSPWPRKPFTQTLLSRIPTLQDYIPQSLLPARLIVHDPWELLNPQRHRYREQEEDKETNYDWSSKDDIIHIYKLQISREGKRILEDDAEAKLDLEKRAQRRTTFLAEPHSKHQDNYPSGGFLHPQEAKPGPAKPPIFIVFPLRANREQAPEAHLYLSPARKIGEGNHSFVYKAEFELPRNQLFEEILCHFCVLDDVAKQLAEEDGMDRERRDPKWEELSGRYVLKTKETQGTVTDMKHPITGRMTTYRLEDKEQTAELVYEGPIRAIESRVQYQDLSKAPYCKHIQEDRKSIHPLTSTVHVAAKLSIQHDRHLANEARNYQKFPRHFFEHWSGYTIINPLHNPVPVGPVVPQFYGYYVVEEEKKPRAADVRSNQGGTEDQDKNEQGEDHTKEQDTETEEHNAHESDSDDGYNIPSSDKNYLSPILLIEDCGKPIVAPELSIDDREQSASLVYRFHEEGWHHGSVAQRNILRQPGPLSDFPLGRMVNETKRGGLGEEWSFRLIDFGRSCKTTSNHNLISEESVLTGWVFENVGDLPP